MKSPNVRCFTRSCNSNPNIYIFNSAYWPTQKKTQKKSQAQSGSLSDPEEDDRPLLPRHKPRLLVEDDNEGDGDVEFMATGQSAAGRRGTQRNQIRDNRVTLGTSAQRTKGGERSLASDTYDDHAARSGISKTTHSKAATKATATRGRNKLLVEDNDTTIDWASSPSTAKGGKSSFESSGTATLDENPSSTAKKGTQKRKALAVDVDDDEGVSLNRCYSGRSGAYSINRDLETLGRGEDVDAQCVLMLEQYRTTVG